MNSVAAVPNQIQTDAVTQALEQATQTDQAPKLTKKQRQKKGEYMRQLEEENSRLKSEIQEYQQKITTLGAQNEALQNQLDFFQKFQVPGQDREHE